MSLLWLLFYHFVADVSLLPIMFKATTALIVERLELIKHPVYCMTLMMDTWPQEKACYLGLSSRLMILILYSRQSEAFPKEKEIVTPWSLWLGRMLTTWFELGSCMGTMTRKTARQYLCVCWSKLLGDSSLAICKGRQKWRDCSHQSANCKRNW